MSRFQRLSKVYASLGVSRRVAYHWAKHGLLPGAFLDDKLWLVDTHKLIPWMRELSARPDSSSEAPLEWVRLSEVYREIGVSYRVVLYRARQRMLPCAFQHAGTWFVDRFTFNQWMDERSCQKSTRGQIAPTSMPKSKPRVSASEYQRAFPATGRIAERRRKRLANGKASLVL